MLACMRLGFVLLILFTGLAGISQQPDLDNTYWPAQWITCSQAASHDVAVCHLRKSFILDSVPSHFVVLVSADNRYRLFVDGKPVSRGPSRGDLDHWRFEAVDLAPELRRGRNVLAAVVWNYGDLAPMAQMSKQTGFVLQAATDVPAAVNTDASWKAMADFSRRPIPTTSDKVAGYYAAGTGERVDGAAYPWGWQGMDYSDSGWTQALPLGHAGLRGMRDTHSPWMLISDPLPAQMEKRERFVSVARSKGIAIPTGFLQGRAPLVVPAHTEASILLDQSYETTAYPKIVTSGGAGSQIRLTYAESLVSPDGTKGNRNEIAGKTIRGIYDEYLPDGGSHRSFSPLWWRTYRFVLVSMQTGASPLTVEDLRADFTAYPFRRVAAFTSDDPELRRIWDVGWRTAVLCAHETYMDSPYYEQLQYAGDTRIQGLISLYLTGDDRLLRNAIELLANSQTSEGLTQSRYPSAMPQYIPGFSLLWIGMMHDLWWYRGETKMLRPLLPNARATLAWYKRHLSPTDLPRPLPWWPFVDWAPQFQDGVPPEQADGQSASLGLEFAVALEEMADLESAFGNAQEAKRDRNLAATMNRVVFQLCWDPERHLLADTPQKKSFSQQANVLGILSGAVPATLQKPVMERVLIDPELTQASYYFRFYLFRAMKQAGLAGKYLKQLGPWREMLAQGLTTFAETPGNPRSDCHAWSAHPVIDLLATVAGVEPSSPGFVHVRIEPNLGNLHTLDASIPVPQGTIAVRYRIEGKYLSADISLPSDVSGQFVWQGRPTVLHPGHQHLLLPATGQNTAREGAPA